jgi:hypothetical protein
MFIPYFLPDLHDAEAKEFMGVSFAARNAASNTEFLVRRDEVGRLVDTIFEKRPRAVAEFICRKIYQFFVYSNPSESDESTIEAMADVLIENDFEIRPVMAALLKSAHFFDNANLGAQIKSPAEYNVGFARQIGGKRILARDMVEMEQLLFEPPNVSGWPGYREWITTSTYPTRSDVAQQIIVAMNEEDCLGFIRQFPDYTDVTLLTRNIAALLLPRPLSSSRHNALELKLLGGQPGYEWEDIVNDPDASTASRNLRDMLTAITSLPDFQLC